MKKDLDRQNIEKYFYSVNTDETIFATSFLISEILRKSDISTQL